MPADTANPAELYESIFVPAIFGPLAELTFAAAAPAAGETAVDLACGTGIVARRLAPALGAAGRVIAIDLRPGMIAVAESRPPPEGAPVAWRQGDATALDLPEGIADLVVCQQGLQFFPDRPAAMAEMHRVLRPRGRLVLAVWCNVGELGLMDDLIAVEARHLADLDVSLDEIALPFTCGDPALLTDLVRGAGFGEVAIRTEEVIARFPSAETFVADVERPYSAVIGAFATDPARFEAFVTAVQADLAPAIAPWRDDAGVRFPMHTRIVTARH
jgi:SAM-dependent methyltransferase